MRRTSAIPQTLLLRFYQSDPKNKRQRVIERYFTKRLSRRAGSDMNTSTTWIGNDDVNGGEKFSFDEYQSTYIISTAEKSTCNVAKKSSVSLRCSRSFERLAR